MQIRKNILLLFILPALLLACEPQDVANKYDKPEWTFTSKPEYSVSMTAAVMLPTNLNPFLTENDMMVALVGDEVRAVGNLYEGIFYLHIQGSDSEVSEVTFRYWNARTLYMYQAEEVVPFRENDILGTPDKPLVLKFKAI